MNRFIKTTLSLLVLLGFYCAIEAQNPGLLEQLKPGTVVALKSVHWNKYLGVKDGKYIGLVDADKNDPKCQFAIMRWKNYIGFKSYTANGRNLQAVPEGGDKFQVRFQNFNFWGDGAMWEQWAVKPYDKGNPNLVRLQAKHGAWFCVVDPNAAWARGLVWTSYQPGIPAGPGDWERLAIEIIQPAPTDVVPGGTTFAHRPEVYGEKLQFHENWKLVEPGKGWVKFKARALNDLDVAFARLPQDIEINSPAAGVDYRIIVGGWDNTQSVIRRNSGGAWTSVNNNIELALSNITSGGNPNAIVTGGKPSNGSAWDDYWFQVNDGVVTWGKGVVVGQNELMRYVDPAPLRDVQYVLLGGYHNSSVEFKDIEFGLPPEVVAKRAGIDGFLGQQVNAASDLNAMQTTLSGAGDYRASEVSAKLGEIQTERIRRDGIDTVLGQQVNAASDLNAMQTVLSGAGGYRAGDVSVKLKEIQTEAKRRAGIKGISLTAQVAINLPEAFEAEEGMAKCVAVGSRGGELEAWALAFDDQLYRYDVYSAAPLPWVKYEFKDASGSVMKFLDVSCASDGTMVALDLQGKALRYDWDQKTWRPIAPGQGNEGLALDVISVGNGGCIWAVDVDEKNIYELTGQGWQLRANGIGIFVAAGIDGTVVGLNQKGEVFRYQQGAWIAMPGVELERIAVGNRNYIIGSTSNDNALWEWKDGKWQSMLDRSGKQATGLDEIAINAVGTIFGTDEDGTLYHKGDKGVALVDPPSTEVAGMTQRVLLTINELIGQPVVTQQQVINIPSDVSSVITGLMPELRVGSSTSGLVSPPAEQVKNIVEKKNVTTKAVEPSKGKTRKKRKAEGTVKAKALKEKTVGNVKDLKKRVKKKKTVKQAAVIAKPAATKDVKKKIKKPAASKPVAQKPAQETSLQSSQKSAQPAKVAVSKTEKAEASAKKTKKVAAKPSKKTTVKPAQKVAAKPSAKVAAVAKPPVSSKVTNSL